jgi:hypothetical protein
MAAAVLTPRIRLMTICDGVRESAAETGVFHLKRVRQAIHANDFPFPGTHLCLFIALSSVRAGEYPVYIRVVNDRTDKTIFHGKAAPNPTFQENNDYVARRARIKCAFPEPGRYTVQVWFFQEHGSDVLKGEQPFSVLSRECVMNNKTQKTKRMPTLQEFVVIPITDPAEQAELDRRCREAEKAMAVADRTPRKHKTPKRK